MCPALERRSRPPPSGRIRGGRGERRSGGPTLDPAQRRAGRSRPLGGGRDGQGDGGLRTGSLLGRRTLTSIRDAPCVHATTGCPILLRRGRSTPTKVHRSADHSDNDRASTSSLLSYPTCPSETRP